MDMCRLENNQPGGKMKAIKLIELSSAFLVLGIGVALSALSFFLELFFGSYTAKRQKGK